MPISHDLFRQNHILDSLSDQAARRIIPHLSQSKLDQGAVIYQIEQPITNVYFPTGAVVSIVGYTLEGHSAEIGVIGNEGVVGIDAIFGGAMSPYENAVQLADGMLQIKSARLAEEFNRCGSLHAAILRFARHFIAQVSQTAVCNRLHPLEQRLARWILMCDDRSVSDELGLTQEFLATMAGATRATVTLAAIKLKSEGFIRYHRGKIAIVDREKLENFTCECYAVIRNAYDEWRPEPL